LAAAIQEALGEHAQGCAKKIGENMRTEQGVQNAVRSFHQHLDAEALRCSICPDRPAVWWIRRSHIKLSAFAMSILLHTGHIKARDVQLYAFQDLPLLLLFFAIDLTALDTVFENMTPIATPEDLFQPPQRFYTAR
jgi:hypothetical protein